MRLFIAIDPGAAVVARIGEALETLRPLSPRSKWIHTDGAHITLAFLGEVEDARAPAVAEALLTAAQRHAPMTMRIAGGGGFGRERRPRVLFAGVTGEPASLSALAAAQRDVERELVPLGYRPEERAFTPHITLARAREAGGDAGLFACVEAIRGLDFGEARIEALLAYRSDTTPSGAKYTAIAEARLSPRG